MDESLPLPELHQGELDPATLRQLFADLRVHAEVLEIIPKFGRGYVVDAVESPSLDDALAMIEGGQLRGLQIRYRYQGEVWWDTLMPQNGSACRLVRVRHQDL